MRITPILLFLITCLSAPVLKAEPDSSPLPEKRDWYTWIHDVGSNVEMKNRAWEAIIALDDRMEGLLAELMEQLDGEAWELLQQSQESWQDYAYRQSALEAGSMRGGTGQGLRHSLSLIREQTRRLGELQALLADRSRPH